MNYLFSHLGKEPKHLSYFFNSILSVDAEANIFFINDYNYESKFINSFNLDVFPNLIEKLNFIDSIVNSTNVAKNPLWSTSILRLFALEELVTHTKIKKFLHFDTDVILYKSFNELEKSNVFSKNQINITYHDSNSLVFGYSYFPNVDLLSKLLNHINQILFNYKNYQERLTSTGDGFISEMKMLSICDKLEPNLFNYLKSLPYWNATYLFDPAGYGQYLDGSHIKRGNYYIRRRWVGLNTEVGRELKAKRIKVSFNNKQPTVVYDNVITELASLHIHSKRLRNFLPNDYKNLI
jgi:hypothetical protein